MALEVKLFIWLECSLPPTVEWRKCRFRVGQLLSRLVLYAVANRCFMLCSVICMHCLTESSLKTSPYMAAQNFWNTMAFGPLKKQTLLAFACLLLNMMQTSLIFGLLLPRTGWAIMRNETCFGSRPRRRAKIINSARKLHLAPVLLLFMLTLFKKIGKSKDKIRGTQPGWFKWRRAVCAGQRSSADKHIQQIWNLQNGNNVPTDFHTIDLILRVGTNSEQA